MVVGCPIGIATTRTLQADPRDVGHLAAQELILRLARAAGIGGTFEVRSRDSASSLFIDVGLRDDRHRVVSVIEIWNRIGDLGDGARSFARKLADAEAIAIAAGGDGGDGGPYRVTGCWVLRATAANRALVGRFPAIFAAAFPGSSRHWVEALTTGTPPPGQPGVVWADLAGTRLYEVRLRAGQAHVSRA